MRMHAKCNKAVLYIHAEVNIKVITIIIYYINEHKKKNVLKLIGSWSTEPRKNGNDLLMSTRM